AEGNANRLALIDQMELDERLQRRELYWTEVDRLTQEQGGKLAAQEAALAQRRAELDGDPAEAARIRAAEALRIEQEHFDQMERDYAGNAARLEQIARMRNDAIAL